MANGVLGDTTLCLLGPFLVSKAPAPLPGAKRKRPHCELVYSEPDVRACLCTMLDQYVGGELVESAYKVSKDAEWPSMYHTVRSRRPDLPG